MARQDQPAADAPTADTEPAAGIEPGAEVETAADALPEPLANIQNLPARFTDGDITVEDWIALWTDLGWPVTKVIVLILAVLILSGWARRFVTASTRRARVDETLARFFGNLAKYTILILGGLAVLSTFGVNTTSFAAVIAAAGFALGMALSGTMGNFASGVLLLVFRPFKVGDVVTAAGVTAKVEEIGMFSTVFDTFDNRRIIVPNGAVYGSNIENVTYHSTRRVDVAVGTEYSADLDKTREVLMAAASAVEGRLPDKDPVVYLNELGDSSINWAVRVWAKTPDFWAVRERLTRDVKVALDNADIGIPFPQRDLHVPGAIRVRVSND